MAASMRFTFSKNERLSSRKILTELFEKGKSIVVSPFRVSFFKTVLSSSSPVQIAFSVPVKNFRQAVDRNRIKRQMREVYRKNKSSVYALLESQKIQCAMMIVFIGKVKPSFEEVEQKLKLTLLRLEEEFKKNAE
jgi:ribonuclease P protein component